MEPPQQGLLGLAAPPAHTEADQVERGGRGQSKRGVGRYQGRELLRQPHMLADVVL